MAFDDRPAEWFCVWEGSGGTGRTATFQLSVPDLGDLQEQCSVPVDRGSGGARWAYLPE
ncbi:peptidase inhibitor family I36 protein [Amycolatopsis sp. NPDC051371]|uniref:peptidase inhibitor family I36 protein n=1 Tax=Amycolatopsis sp. NPDC051371 TaxID=3155800 RepID=UPI00343030FD